ncbi:MAG TPA: 5-formyltetrahydrofolate cyclo-ligase [Steroidobacteraceae bacterium]|jgi:5-formyltetrahydrofolate cyclo-ligase
MSGVDNRTSLRRQMRAQRRALTIEERTRAARQIARVATRALLLRPAAHLGLYITHHAEADTQPLIEAARKRGCHLYLPVITDYRSARMRFVRYTDETKLVRNRYGIPEPIHGAATHISTRLLDVIFVPVVAVDARGWRIGSGAGFYDRCLHHLRYGRMWRRPKLIGLGYDFQRVPLIAAQPWDVPLDGLITEKGFYRFVPGRGTR